MTKVGKVWSWLVEKIRGSRSSRKIGPPSREIPQIPEPKARGRATYTLVLINESGRSRQIELTPLKLRGALISIVAIFALAILGGYSAGRSSSDRPRSTSQEKALVEKVSALQDELRKKDLALTVQEKRLAELTAQSTVVAVTRPGERRTGMDDGGEPSEALPRLGSAGPLTSAIGSSTGEEAERPVVGRTTERGEDRYQSSAGSTVRPQRRLTREEPVKSSSPFVTEPEASPSSQAIMNFNANELTAVAEDPNGGMLSFRLVKDRPDVRFVGYLFVYVEMVDERGETKLYAYPNQTRRGDGDLPSDYREGERIAFKYNSRVELPYGDIRSGASLAGVSILLYGEDGKIVFQRGFSREELKTADSGVRPAGVKARTSPRNRRAL
ncbi:MAG: hypothetical protein FJY85_20215 [Deltaproteobacteria bacterium]|nr:hypothetical protein [Deltaproteobacteria bacterium]